jgi:membrane-bound serine protease (ClpP class)
MLILSPYALEILPGSWFGIVLVLLAFVLLVVDLTVTNHGLPTVGGLVALVLGVLMLFDVTGPYLWVLLITVVAIAMLMGIFLVVALGKVRATTERPVTTGLEGMVGEVGVVKETVGASYPGWVFVHGEWWRAIAAIAPEDAHKQGHEQVIDVGLRVQVVGFSDGNVAVVPFDGLGWKH